MRAVDLIQKKKTGLKHTKEEIDFLINGYMNGVVDDYQISAWLMAVCFNDLDIEETAWLTEAYINSGEILDFSDISNNIADKHSTGGVGDKVTLVLIPLLASCGLHCAKLSGRGLGYTGGTIDKLESIKNFNCQISNDKFKKQIKEIGAGISAQTPNLTPADGKTYALRDVTATVDNKSLICASVVSKKIASGADHIVLDVKYGSGAFVKTKEDAYELASLMIKIGHQLKRNIRAVITSMEQPLGKFIGNALEVYESIEFLKGNWEDDLYEVTMKIASLLLENSGIVKNEDEALKLLNSKIQSGEALDKFKQIIQHQEGDVNVIDDYSILNISESKTNIISDKTGYITNLDALSIAKACKIVGAGRDKKTDPIDFGVGIELKSKIGDFVNKGDTLAILYATKNIEDAVEIAKNAYTINEYKSEIEPLIYKTI
ncbi:MAG: thymidine phosphorylase [Cyanobacteria bacterium SIG30]|nr:thymidine phosphorylase [Cyanobacteria bacterium SIG30]